MEEAGAAPHVGIVVLNWNGRDDTLACLASLRALEWKHVTTIVVDNGSTDGTPAEVRCRYPEVEVIECGRNLGFAEGNNVGIRRALELGLDYVLLLNNDTIVESDALTVLVREAERRPDAGALCPIIYYDESEGLIWYAGAKFDPRRGRNRRHTGYRERDAGRYREVSEVTHATGAAVLVPRRMIEEVGLLDPALFLQVEDVDWTLRMRAAGYRAYFVPSARVWHRVSRAAGGEHIPLWSYYNVRNRLEVCERHAPLSGPRALRRSAATLVEHLVHARRSARPLDNARAALAGWRDHRAGRLGPREHPVPRDASPFAANGNGASAAVDGVAARRASAGGGAAERAGGRVR
jgi:GT2 family glycosyltransferase